MVLNFIILFSAYIGMEFVAWFTHKYIMHGFLWILHRDHHNKDLTNFFERNDFFFLLFAIPGILGLFFGTINDFNFLFWIGLGITFYGATYFLVHDVFIHQRFKFINSIDNKYFQAIRKAHRDHHKHLDKQDGECFGMLWAAPKYFKNKS